MNLIHSRVLYLKLDREDVIDYELIAVSVVVVKEPRTIQFENL
jgi:hypothetical protein